MNASVPKDERSPRAISLWQPWASLLFTEPRTKIHETRHWGTSYRGRMYIHAAKRPIRADDLHPKLNDLCIDFWGGHFRRDLPFGAIIGVVRLIDCVRTDSIAPHTTPEDLLCGNFSPGRFAWSMGMPQRIGPWPYRGQQGMWSISDSELDAIANQQLGITNTTVTTPKAPAGRSERFAGSYTADREHLNGVAADQTGRALEHCDHGCVQAGEPDMGCPVHGIDRQALDTRTDQIMDEWQVGRLGKV